MKVCFAVQKDDGVESVVYGHFGSAPAFIVVDTGLGSTAAVDNHDLGHVHGACNPILALGGLSVDAVVVGDIGAGAITRLRAEGIKVYRSAAETVRQNLDLLQGGQLPEILAQNACGGHQQGRGGCSH